MLTMQLEYVLPCPYIPLSNQKRRKKQNLRLSEPLAQFLGLPHLSVRVQNTFTLFFRLYEITENGFGDSRNS